MTAGPKLLLDTCAIIFTAGGSPLKTEAYSAIKDANLKGRVFVSPISAWEIGLSMARGRIKSTLSAIEFFEQFAERSLSKICDLNARILASSTVLPRFDNRDPADCILIATARSNDYTIVTRDQSILGYGGQGYVKVLAC